MFLIKRCATQIWKRIGIRKRKQCSEKFKVFRFGVTISHSRRICTQFETFASQTISIYRRKPWSKRSRNKLADTANRTNSRRINQYQARYTYNSGISCLPSFCISVYYCFDFIPFIPTVEMGVTLLEGTYSHQRQDSLPGLGLALAAVAVS